MFLFFQQFFNGMSLNMSTLTLTATAEDYRIARLAALAIGVHVLEAAFPAIVPGIKPGLANIITLAAYFLLGWRAAVWVSLLRVLGGSLLLGTFMSPTFVLSLGGALASLLMLGGVHVLARSLHLHRLGLSAVGFAVLMAMAHISGQFLLAWWLFIPHPGLWALLPVLMLSALATGVLSGIICNYLLNKVNNAHGSTAGH